MNLDRKILAAYDAVVMQTLARRREPALGFPVSDAAVRKAHAEMGGSGYSPEAVAKSKSLVLAYLARVGT